MRESSQIHHVGYCSLLGFERNITSVAVLLKFWAHEILLKFWRNFRWNFLQYFGKFRPFLPPPPPPSIKNKHEKFLKKWQLHSANFKIFAEISIIPLEIWYYADLNNFNVGMFNCVQVIWLGLCDTNRIKCFRKISSKFHSSRVIFFDQTFTRKFHRKVANFRSKIFCKLSREILTKVSFPQH